MLMRGNPLPAPNNPLPAVQGNPLGDIPPDILQKIQQGVAEGNPMAIQAAQALKIPISGQTNAAVMPQGVQARMNASAPQPGLLNTPNAPVPSTIAPNQNTGAPAASAVAQNMMAQPAQAPMPQQAQAVTAQAASAPAAPTNDKGFLGIPKELMYGAGMGLLARSRDPNADVMGAFLTGSQQFKKQQALTQFTDQLKKSNISPELKQMIAAGLQTGDPKIVDQVMKLYQNATERKLVTPGATYVDAQGNVIYENPAAAIGGRGGVQGQLKEQFRQQLAFENGWDKKKSDEARSRYLEGKTTFRDGSPLPPLSGTARSFMRDVLKGETTASLITQGVQANQADKEIQVLSQFAQHGMKPYGTTYLNMNPSQIIDSFKSSGKSQQDLGKFIASQQMQFEIAQNQIKLANGQPGVTTTQELLDIANQRINTKFPRLSFEARKAAQDYMNAALQAGLETRNRIGIGSEAATGGIPVNQTSDPLEQQAQDAIAQGADPAQVYARLSQLRRQQG